MTRKAKKLRQRCDPRKNQLKIIGSGESDSGINVVGECNIGINGVDESDVGINGADECNGWE